MATQSSIPVRGAWQATGVFLAILCKTWDLTSPNGVPIAVEAQNLNHWTTREAQNDVLLTVYTIQI